MSSSNNNNQQQDLLEALTIISKSKTSELKKEHCRKILKKFQFEAQFIIDANNRNCVDDYLESITEEYKYSLFEQQREQDQKQNLKKKQSFIRVYKDSKINDDEDHDVDNDNVIYPQQHINGEINLPFKIRLDFFIEKLNSFFKILHIKYQS
ncbi:hypothetical protein CYY_007101 [Polysphondylium violaceum]|uniref:Uncharacterized protein n=1 Tax=Polysphondylium violaceum TaxID=133409 RepID=A0A8J4PP52_9MYCE|nr:hypothetical protein CYY_007101 [Polysphondylium violaceum]